MKNKGFTMVELLVAMAIMGLLIIMAFPTIRAIQSNNTSTKYKEYGKSALSASKLYVDSYEEDLFDLNDNNGMKSIYLDELVKKDLLKDISISDSTCLNGSSVNIIKYKDDYTYCLNLICSTGGKEVYTELSKEGKCKDLVLYKVTYSYGSTHHDVSVIQGNNHTVLTPGAAHINIPNGYRFVSWNSSSGNKKPGDIIEVNNNIKFTPKLEPFKYKIRYKSSIAVDDGSMPDQTCTVGQSCKLLPNKYVKYYYKFDVYEYNGKTYKVGKEMKNLVNITKDDQIVIVNSKFIPNNVTINYYSNGGKLKPGKYQICPKLAGCKKNECKWPQNSGCVGKNDLVYNVTLPHTNKSLSAEKDGLADYVSNKGSIYMTRSGCTGTHYWLINNKNSSLKAHDQNKSFPTQLDFAIFAGKEKELKKNDVSINVYAEWNCPSYTLTIKKDNNINLVKMDGVSTTSKKVKYGTTVKVEVGAKDYFHTRWADNNSTATTRNVKVTKNMTLTVNSVKNLLHMSMYSNGGKLTPGTNQLCRKQAGCSKNQCLGNHEINNPNEVAKCRNSTGLIYVGSPDAYDNTALNVSGLRDYASKNGTLYMTKNGCTATGYWHVDSEISTTKINETQKYLNAKEFVKACGAKYDNNYKKKDISIKLYAGWNCPNEIICQAGKYLPKSKTSCATCTSGNYCKGGIFKKNIKKDQGLTPCPTGYKNSAAGSSKITQCYIIVNAGKYIKTKRSTTKTSCDKGKYKEQHNVYYDSTSSCNNCPNGYPNSAVGSKADTSCYMNVNAGYHVAKAKAATPTSCEKGTFKEEHIVYYKNTSACDTCPSGYKNGAGTTKKSNCIMKVKKDHYVKKAKDSSSTSCGTGHEKSAHEVKYGKTSSCSAKSYKCKKKYYLPKSKTSCAKCTSGNYCKGGTFKYSTSKNQGLTDCPSGYGHSAAGSDQASDCYMKVSKNHYVKKSKASKSSKCASGSFKSAHNVHYGKTSSCTKYCSSTTVKCSKWGAYGSCKCNYEEHEYTCEEYRHRTCRKVSSYNSNYSCGKKYTDSGSRTHKCLGGCFLAGTKVQTPLGKIDINKILPGQEVLGFNEEKQINEYNKVLIVYKHQNVKDILYTLYFDDNTKLRVTSKHPIYVSRNNYIFNYVLTENLKVNDIVKYSDYSTHKITKIESINIYDTIYNLEVENTHNYYVGEQNVLVHNKV